MADNLKNLRSALEKEQERLNAELAQLDQSVNQERREGSPFGKREEEATESAELEKRLALEQRVKAQLSDVEHALAKFEDGSYGICDNCGKKIARERLEALPSAALCMTCKAELSKNAREHIGAG